MRIHTLIQAPFEKPGVIKDWALDRGHDFSETHTYAGERVPDSSSIDFLIVMGGPQSAVHLHEYPYLHDEVALTKKIIHQNKPVLGICLGAQIIGESLGAKTEKSPHKEVGDFPIKLTPDAAHDPIFKLFPQTFEVMHWHGDMPGLSKDCVLLAASDGCPRQAFRYGDRVYGFQFHMELTPSLIQDMIKHCPDDLATGQYIQAQEAMLAGDHVAPNEKMRATLDYLAGLG